ncbi:MAG: type II toxin-antitoxin system VapC family toxin [Planctomycetes bacterium]|nr:type II toxin-antitoxin system VapC family toxin [Planctomycetota bacterium]
MVALFVEQKRTSDLRRLYAEDPQVLAWILSDLEVHSALCRLEREGAISHKALTEAATRFETFWAGVVVVSHLEAVKIRSRRLLRTHALKAADSMQLGAALVGAAENPIGWDFVCLDERLRSAAGREGFILLP